MKIFNRIISTKTIIFLLGIILLWRVLKNNLILLLAIAYLVWSEKTKKECPACPTQEVNEAFDQTGRIFAAVGEDKYDLKGERLYFHPVEYDVPRPRYSCCRH